MRAGSGGACFRGSEVLRRPVPTCLLVLGTLRALPGGRPGLGEALVPSAHGVAAAAERRTCL